LQDTSMAFPVGDRVSRQYFPLHSPTQLSTGAAYNLTIARSVWFDSLGRIAMQVAGNGATGHRYTYDGLERVLTDSSVNNPAPPASCTGNPAPTIDAYGNSCVEAGGWSATGGTQFAYDAVGNRTDNGGTYNTGNRITAFAGCTYGSDNDGNANTETCGTQVTTASLTAESRLASVASGATTVAFQYDPLGRLVRKDLNGSPESYFLWDGFNLLAELTSTGTGLVAEYSYYPGLDHLHAIVVGGHQYNAHTDALGNVIALTDSAQAVKRTYQYDAWGNLTGGSDNLPFNNADRARWKGALWLGPEFNQLYYLRNRWYYARLGRFLSEDPMWLAAAARAPQARFLWRGDDLHAAVTKLGTGESAEDPISRRQGSRSSAHENGLGAVVASPDNATAVKRAYGQDGWDQLSGWRDVGSLTRGRSPSCGVGARNPYIYAEDRPTNGSDPSGEQFDPEGLCEACWAAFVAAFAICTAVDMIPPCPEILAQMAEDCIAACQMTNTLGGGGGGGFGGSGFRDDEGGMGGGWGGGGCYDVYVDEEYAGTVCDMM